MSVDLAIRNGLVVDGTGAEPLRADVGRRRATGSSVVGDVPEAAREIDAAGKVVAPGFIDIHSHSDFTLLVDPRAASAVHQGVTLEVVGNCGFGCFPLLNKELAPKAIYGHSADVPLTWTTAAGYFERLEEAAPAINVASLAPNGQIRLSVVGLADRPARPDELAQMRYLLDEALEQGAWGYSTGLEYAAERGADEDELVAMCEVCGRRHGDLRDAHAPARRGRRRGRRGGAPDGRALRRAAAGLASRPAQRASTRRAAASSSSRVRPRSGMDVAFDMHTRLYGTTFLLTALPPWALEDPARLREILGSKEQRRAMRGYESILSAGGDWSRIVLLDNDVWPGYARRDVAVDRGRARAGAARRRLRPPARRGRRSRAADGDHPRLHRGAAARGVRPPALRSRLGRDDDGADRPARREDLPRRLHLGGVVPPLLRPAGEGAEPARGDPPAHGCSRRSGSASPIAASSGPAPTPTSSSSTRSRSGRRERRSTRAGSPRGWTR